MPSQHSIRMQVRSQGNRIVAFISFGGGKEDVWLAEINRHSCDLNREVYEDFLALCTKMMKTILEDAIPEAKITGYAYLPPGAPEKP